MSESRFRSFNATLKSLFTGMTSKQLLAFSLWCCERMRWYCRHHKEVTARSRKLSDVLKQLWDHPDDVSSLLDEVELQHTNEGAKSGHVSVLIFAECLDVVLGNYPAPSVKATRAVAEHLLDFVFQFCENLVWPQRTIPASQLGKLERAVFEHAVMKNEMLTEINAAETIAKFKSWPRLREAVEGLIKD